MDMHSPAPAQAERSAGLAPGTIAINPCELGGDEGGTTVTTSDGEQKVIPKKADFGTVSSGGLY